MTTSTPASQLQDLARQIAKQESELTSLRRRLDSRLEILHGRRESLRAQLRSIETELEAAPQAAPRSDSPVSTQIPSNKRSAVIDTNKTTFQKKATVSPIPKRALRSMLVDVLTKAESSLTAQQLADAAKKAGYRSASKDFLNVVHVTICRMPEVERDPRGGYRLKKGKR